MAGRLICPADDILNEQALWQRLELAFEDARDASAIRKLTVDELRATLKSGRANIAEALAKAPYDAHPATAAYSFLTDCVVRCVHRVATERLHPLPLPTTAERIAVIAVGGMGAVKWRRSRMWIFCS